MISYHFRVFFEILERILFDSVGYCKWSFEFKGRTIEVTTWTGIFRITSRRTVLRSSRRRRPSSPGCQRFRSSSRPVFTEEHSSLPIHTKTTLTLVISSDSLCYCIWVVHKIPIPRPLHLVPLLTARLTLIIDCWRVYNHLRRARYRFVITVMNPLSDDYHITGFTIYISLIWFISKPLGSFSIVMIIHLFNQLECRCVCTNSISSV